MNSPIPFMYLVGYDRKFQELARSGWGCGYIAIPENHPVIVNYLKRISEEQAAKDSASDDEYIWVDDYIRINGMEQETTYTIEQVINGNKYYVLGFDTAHSYNDVSNDFNWVFNETIKILNLVNSIN